MDRYDVTFSPWAVKERRWLLGSSSTMTDSPSGTARSGRPVVAPFSRGLLLPLPPLYRVQLPSERYQPPPESLWLFGFSTSMDSGAIPTSGGTTTPLLRCVTVQRCLLVESAGISNVPRAVAGQRCGCAERP